MTKSFLIFVHKGFIVVVRYCRLQISADNKVIIEYLRFQHCKLESVRQKITDYRLALLQKLITGYFYELKAFDAHSHVSISSDHLLIE